jgi:hypothetical protein
VFWPNEFMRDAPKLCYIFPELSNGRVSLPARLRRACLSCRANPRAHLRNE